MENGGGRTDGLDPGILAALDEVLTAADGGDAALFGRVRALVENCLADNYDPTDVRSVIELAVSLDGGRSDGA
ncbi:hypothetical protein [Sphingomonas sp. S2-65]|uniref:hypothetical protein n=1 Tax=Sphingomonas sp. S2-65 TaxID=2903960 RepID=UPI001F2AB9FD|nr:hypothetical protein [Sphingomonas sp. S2-65]UYY58046.1 hypothetical protein LZ586_15480 [Sphingomonas sp. S2-65]